jgi:hypothetical protein
MISENSLKNLELGRFTSEKQPKVHSKRGASPLTTIKKYLTKKVDVPDPITHLNKRLSIGEVIALQWLAKAFKGDAEAIKDIIDRTDGKALQRFLNEGSDVIITAPPVINFIAVYKGKNADTGEIGYRSSGALPGSIESESKV